MNIPAETLIVPLDKSYSSPQCTSLPRPCERTWLAVSNTRLTLRLKTLQTLDPPGKVTKSHHNDGRLDSFTHSHMKRAAEKEGSLTSTARAAQTKGRGAVWPRDNIIRHWRTGNLPNCPLSRPRWESLCLCAGRRRPRQRQTVGAGRKMEKFSTFFLVPSLDFSHQKSRWRWLSEASSLILKPEERQPLIITIKQSWVIFGEQTRRAAVEVFKDSMLTLDSNVS